MEIKPILITPLRYTISESELSGNPAQPAGSARLATDLGAGFGAQN